MPSSGPDTPNTVPWPPLLYIAAVVIGLWLDRWLPGQGWLETTAARMGGASLAVAGVALDVAAMLALAAHRTSILPHRAAVRLVTSGPFSWTRNPIYLGNTLVMAGAAGLLGSPGLLMGAFAAAVAVERLAIVREEQHLHARFGHEWTEYRSRTRRSIGRRSRRRPSA